MLRSVAPWCPGAVVKPALNFQAGLKTVTVTLAEDRLNNSLQERVSKKSREHERRTPQHATTSGSGGYSV